MTRLIPHPGRHASLLWSRSVVRQECEVTCLLCLMQSIQHPRHVMQDRAMIRTLHQAIEISPMPRKRSAAARHSAGLLQQAIVALDPLTKPTTGLPNVDCWGRRRRSLGVPLSLPAMPLCSKQESLRFRKLSFVLEVDGLLQGRSSLFLRSVFEKKAAPKLLTVINSFILLH